MRLGIEELSDSGLTWSLSGTWFIRQWRYYVAGSGVYQKRSLNPVEQWNLYPPGVVSNFYSHSIHGQGKNDIVVAGGFGEVVHFNGTSWLRYDQFTQLAAGNYYRIQIKGNMLAVCRSEFVPSSSAYRMAVKGVLMNCCDPSKKRKVKDMNRTLQPLSVITQFAHEFLFAVSLLVIPAYLFGQTNIRVNQDISVAGRDQNETSIAVSNINPNVIIAASNYVTPTVDYRPAYYRSLDAGGSWVEGILSLQHRHRVVT